MARSADTDPYHNFRFQIIDSSGGRLDPTAGFTRVSVPNVSIENVPYREGVFIWTENFPGIPKVGECEFFKGVFKKDSDFYKWVLQPINGGQNYRSDLTIEEYHITDEFGINGTPSRKITLLEAFPVDFKPSADHDANTNDVEVTSLKVSVEEILVELISNG